MSSTFSCTPADLLLEIAAHLERSDLLNLCLTSKSFFSNAAPALYSSVVLLTSAQCTSTLTMLKRRKDIARHVQELVIRPSRSNNAHEHALLDSLVVSAAVAEIAASRSLDALSKFTWWDDEIAYHEEMWLALRMWFLSAIAVPQHQHRCLLSAHQQSINFTDLLGFSLFLAPGFYENNSELLLDDERPAGKKLWDMLFKRCPNLEELVIEGFSSFAADAHCLVDGRWPNLQKLALGDVSIDWDSPSPAAKCPFISFLEAHTELQSLAQHMDADAFKLTSFSGTLPQLQELSHSYSSLKSLTFRDPIWSRDVTTMTISSMLQQLTSLTELTISFMLQSPYDSNNILRTLTLSCPHIHHLHLSCFRKTSFQMDAIAKGLPAFRRLRTLTLTLVSTGDLSFPAAGARIARANPRLASFTLAFVPPPTHTPPAPPLPLPFPRTKHASAAFTLVSDAHGLPTALRVRERVTTVWPWPWAWVWGRGATSHVRTRRRVAGLRGVLGILAESSPAGEEMRLFVFCSLLICFAGAFVVKG
ncbi:hypothetical protein B0H13DRAFT_2677367 [Mycena leptocephala]|nr:hypothetical protein B0H13DRAFT_2677367 [Mycena leptocephala]